MTNTSKLIDTLAADATPVRRLKPPLVRAGLWLLGVLVLGVVAILLFSNLAVFSERARDPKLMLELAGTLATGIAAVIAAFFLSLPDRSRGWALLPLPPLALWLASSGYACYRNWLHYGGNGWVIGESASCFAFILGFSLPLGLALFVFLRRARPLSPLPVAVVGGLGVAALAAFLLQFFHPFDVTVMDLGLHLAAVGLVMGAAAFAGRYAPPPRPAAP